MHVLEILLMIMDIIDDKEFMVLCYMTPRNQGKFIPVGIWMMLSALLRLDRLSNK